MVGWMDGLACVYVCLCLCICTITQTMVMQSILSPVIPAIVTWQPYPSPALGDRGERVPPRRAV